MRSVGALLVCAVMAGCASAPAPQQWSLAEALEAAAPALAATPGAVLLGASAWAGDVDENTAEWLEERGFVVLHDDSLMDGAAPMWVLSFAVPSKPGWTPGFLLVQVTSAGTTSVTSSPRMLSGDASGAGHHGAEDICFTAQGDTTVADLDILGRPIDSTALAQEMARDARLATFPGAERFELQLHGARSSYGNEGYWCFEPERTWMFVAHNDVGRFTGVFTSEGDPVTTLDWRNGMAHHEKESVHEFVDPVVPGAFSHEVALELPGDMAHLTWLVRARQPLGVEDIVLRIEDPTGQTYESAGPLSLMSNLKYPAAGAWTITYSYRATLPLGQHTLEIDAMYSDAA